MPHIPGSPSGDPPPGGLPLPPGAIPVGSGVMYPDLQGGLHPTPGAAIGENQRLESDFSRGVSGGCGQDPGKVPSGTGR
jgi:hypothetical protein